jgi:hypothetical protein
MPDEGGILPPTKGNWRKDACMGNVGVRHCEALARVVRSDD